MTAPTIIVIGDSVGRLLEDGHFEHTTVSCDGDGREVRREVQTLPDGAEIVAAILGFDPDERA